MTYGMGCRAISPWYSQCDLPVGHTGLHSSRSGTWCDPDHPCIGYRPNIDFEKHPHHWVCPRCSPAEVTP